MELPEKPEIIRIEQASSLKILTENIRQSVMLGIKTIFEWVTGGRKNSTTSTLAATSPKATKHICNLVNVDELNDGDVVVDLGSGPGPFPQMVLRMTRKKILYIAVELNPKFAQHLRDSVPDDRLVVVNGDARDIESILSDMNIQEKVARILSSLPMSRDIEATTSILKACKRILDPNGVLGMWNFTRTSINQVAEQFGEENCEISSPRWALFLKIIIAHLPEEIKQAA